MKSIIFSLLLLISLTGFTNAPVNDAKNDWVYNLHKAPTVKIKSPIMLDWGTVSITLLYWNTSGGGSNPNWIGYEASSPVTRSYDRRFSMEINLGSLSVYTYGTIYAGTNGSGGHNTDLSDCSNCYYTLTLNQSASSVSWDY